MHFDRIGVGKFLDLVGNACGGWNRRIADGVVEHVLSTDFCSAAQTMSVQLTNGGGLLAKRQHPGIDHRSSNRS